MYITYDALMLVLYNSPDDQQILVNFSLNAYPPVQYIVYCRPRQRSYEVALRIGQRKEIDRRHFVNVDDISVWVKNIKAAAKIHGGEVTFDLLPIASQIRIKLT